MEVKSYPTLMFGKPAQFQTAMLDGLESSGIHVPQHENTHSVQEIVHDIEAYFNLTETQPADQQIATEDVGGKAESNPDAGAQQVQAGGTESPPAPVDPSPGGSGGAADDSPALDDDSEVDAIIEEEEDGTPRADLRDIISATIQVCLHPKTHSHTSGPSLRAFAALTMAEHISNTDARFVAVRL